MPTAYAEVWRSECISGVHPRIRLLRFTGVNNGQFSKFSGRQRQQSRIAARPCGFWDDAAHGRAARAAGKTGCHKRTDPGARRERHRERNHCTADPSEVTLANWPVREGELSGDSWHLAGKRIVRI